jgi:hypothetical protein
VAEDRVRVEVGFEAGQVLRTLADAATADELERALAGEGPRTVELEAEDGRYVIRVDRVAYVKRFVRESRVGFGS